MQIYPPLELVPIPGDLSSPGDGFIWYNSSLNKFRKRENGITSDLDTGGGGSLSGLTIATATNTITNVAYQQEWQWNSLAGSSGLKLSSTILSNTPIPKSQQCI